MIIGKGGKDVDALKEELKKLTDKEVQINIYEIKRPSSTPRSWLQASPVRSRTRWLTAVP